MLMLHMLSMQGNNHRFGHVTSLFTEAQRPPPISNANIKKQRR